MKIRLFVTFHVKPEHVDTFINLMQGAKSELLKVPDCEAVELIQSADDTSKILLSEVWTSKEIHDQYAAKMAATDAMGGVAPLLDGAPEVAVFYIK